VRRVTGIVSALVLLWVLFPAPAQAEARALTVTFRARLDLWDRVNCIDATWDAAQQKWMPQECNPLGPAIRLGLNAPRSPLNPACGATGLCPVPSRDIEYLIDTDTAYPPGDAAPTCIARHTTSGSTPCRVAGQGWILNGATTPSWGAGPYCGWTQGTFVIDVTVAGRTERLFGLGTQDVGSVMHFRVQSNNLITNAGYAVMEITDTRGRCGLDPEDGFAPATELDVLVTLTWGNRV